MSLSERFRALGADGPVERRVEPRDWSVTRRRVRARVIAELSTQVLDLAEDERVRVVRAAIDDAIETEEASIAPTTRAAFVREVLSDIVGHGPLDRLLGDETISEIMCNRYDQIWIERDGVVEVADASFVDDAQYRRVIERIVARVGRRIDESSPMVDARLPDGSRVNAVLPPLAIHGPALTIRKFPSAPLTAADMLVRSNWTANALAVLDVCVRGRMNVLVSGGTGTGKTTVLGVLSSFISPGERIVVIEDAAELQLVQPNLVNLEARPANSEGTGTVSIRDLVRNALRMRPDRIVVGECRGGEALDMLLAMNTGHEGSLTTIHANSPRDALNRLETLVLMAGFDLPVRAIRDQIAAAIHLVVHLERLPDGRRVMRSCSEVQGVEGDRVQLQEVFSAEGDGPLVASGLRPRFADRLGRAGHDLPASLFRAEAPAANGSRP